MVLIDCTFTIYTECVPEKHFSTSHTFTWCIVPWFKEEMFITCKNVLIQSAAQSTPLHNMPQNCCLQDYQTSRVHFSGTLTTQPSSPPFLSYFLLLFLSNLNPSYSPLLSSQTPFPNTLLLYLVCFTPTMLRTATLGPAQVAAAPLGTQHHVSAWASPWAIRAWRCEPGSLPWHVGYSRGRRHRVSASTRSVAPSGMHLQTTALLLGQVGSHSVHTLFPLLSLSVCLFQFLNRLYSGSSSSWGRTAAASASPPLSPELCLLSLCTE